MEVLKKIFNSLFWCFSSINEHNFWYKIVAFLGILLRVGILPLLIPDIFETIANLFVSQLNLPEWLYEIILRIILFIIDGLALSRFFYWISYLSVGNSYESYSTPVWGSFLYTVYYTAYMAIPILLINYFQWWVIAVIFATYLGACIVIYGLSALFNTLPDLWILRAIIHFIIFAIIVTVTCLLKAYIFT